MKTAVTDKLQKALRHIENQGRARDEDLAAYFFGGHPTAVPALLKDAVDSQFLIVCTIQRPGQLDSHEYRLSEAVTAASWPAWNEAYQARINPPSFAQGLDEQAHPAVAKNTGSTSSVLTSVPFLAEGRAVAKAPGTRGLAPSSPAGNVTAKQASSRTSLGAALAEIEILAKQHPTHISGVQLRLGPGTRCQIQIDMDDRTLVLTADKPEPLAA